MLHFEAVLASTLDLLKRIQAMRHAFALRGLTYFDDAEYDPMPEMLEPVTWEGVKDKIESTVRDFVKRL